MTVFVQGVIQLGGTPALVLGSVAAAGSASTLVRTDDTIALTPQINALGNETGGVTWDLASGTVITATLTGNISSLALSNPVVGQVYQLILTHSGGSRTVAWPASVAWAGDSAPSLSANGQVDIITLVYFGSTFYGSFSLDY